MGAQHPLKLSVDPNAADPLAGFNTVISHKQITNVIGPSGSGKSQLLQRISNELAHQFDWLEQLSCKKPLTAFTPSNSNTRVTGGRQFLHISSLAEGFKGKQSLRDLFPALDKTEPTLPSACPHCGKQSVQALGADSLATLLIEKHPGERCIINLRIPCEASSPFLDRDAVLSFLESIGITGKSYLYVGGSTVDVDDPDDCDALFPLVTPELAVVEERIVLRTEQEDRLSEVVKDTHSSGFFYEIHTSQSYSASSEHNWLCSDCLSTGGIESAGIEFRFQDLLTKLPAPFENVVPETIANLPLETTLSSLPRSSQRALLLLSLVARNLESKLVLLDSDTIPLQHTSLVKACLQTLKGRVNTIVFASRSNIHESDALLSLQSGGYKKQQEYPGSMNFPLKTGGVYRIIDTDASLRCAAAQKALFPDFHEEAIQSLSTEGVTPVLYHPLELAPADRRRTLISTPGLAMEIAKLFAKMSHAKEHGLTAQDFKHTLLNPEDRKTPEARETRFKGYTTNDILSLTCEHAARVFEAIPTCKHPLDRVVACGLGALPLSRELASLSSGEIARYCLARLTLNARRNSVLLVPDLTTVLSPDEFTALLDELAPQVEKSRTTILLGIE